MNGNRFRDIFRAGLTWWLRDRVASGKTVGFRYLWSMIAPLDAAVEVLMQGVIASWPGLGTPTALSWIGRSRGIVRGQGETDADYAVRLRAWLDKWRSAGTADALARSIHDFAANHPRVRVITRSGYWVTLEQNGTITRTTAAWDWDGVSHPQRAGFWSELWVIVYPTPFALAPGTFGDDLFGIGDGYGIGHQVTRGESEALRGLLAQWKSAHSRIRAVVWTSDTALFDPAVPASCPDGTWGAWGGVGSGSRVASGRNLSTCRYWET